MPFKCLSRKYYVCTNLFNMSSYCSNNDFRKVSRWSSVNFWAFEKTYNECSKPFFIFLISRWLFRLPLQYKISFSDCLKFVLIFFLSSVCCHRAHSFVGKVYWIDSLREEENSSCMENEHLIDRIGFCFYSLFSMELFIKNVTLEFKIRQPWQ